MKTKSLLVVVLATFITTNLIAQNPPHGHSLDWVPVQTINSPYTIPVGGNPDAFGTALDIDNDIAISGNCLYHSAIIYKRNGNQWTQTQFLNGPISSEFGEEVLILNDQIFISSPQEMLANENQGCVYVYNLDRNTGLCTYSQTLVSNTLNSFSFGESLAGQNNTLIIGSSGDKENSIDAVGAAYLFTKNGNLWNLDPIKITNPDPHFDDQFGIEVGIYDNIIAVSAPNFDLPSYNNVGIVYTFSLTYKSFKVAASLNNTINSPQPSNLSHFGSSMKLKNNSLLLGQPEDNLVYYFRANDCLLLQTLSDPIAGSSFGEDFDFDSNFLIIGSTYYNARKGKATIYKWTQNLWTKTQIELPECRNQNTTFYGECVGLSNDYFIIGAPKVDILKSGIKDKPPFGTSSSSGALIEFFHKEPGLTADAGPDHASCTIDTITLGGNPTASLGNPPYSYYWTDGNTWSSTLPNPIVFPTQSTTYYLRVTDCNGNGNVIYDTVNVFVNSIPFPFDIQNIILNNLKTDNNENIFISGRYINDTIFIHNQPILLDNDAGAILIKLNKFGCLEYYHTFSSCYNGIYSPAPPEIIINSTETGNLYFGLESWSNSLISDISLNMPSFSNEGFFIIGKLNNNGTLAFSIFDTTNFHYGPEYVGHIHVIDQILNVENGIAVHKSCYLYQTWGLPPQIYYSIIDRYDNNGITKWRYTETLPIAASSKNLLSNILSITSSGNILHLFNFSNDSIFIKIHNDFDGNVISSQNLRFPLIQGQESKLLTLNKLSANQYIISYSPFWIDNEYSTLAVKINFEPSTGIFSFANAIIEIPHHFNDCQDYYHNPIPPLSTFNDVFIIPDSLVRSCVRHPVYQHFKDLNLYNQEFDKINYYEIGSVDYLVVTNGENHICYTMSGSDNDQLSFFNGHWWINKFNLNLSKNNNLKISYQTKESNFQNNQDIIICPNPSSHFITITLPDFMNDSYIKVSGIEGKKLIDYKFNNQPLDISGYPKGIYFLQVKNANGVFTKKFIKQ